MRLWFIRLWRYLTKPQKVIGHKPDCKPTPTISPLLNEALLSSFSATITQRENEAREQALAIEKRQAQDKLELERAEAAITPEHFKRAFEFAGRQCAIGLSGSPRDIYVFMLGVHVGISSPNEWSVFRAKFAELCRQVGIDCSFDHERISINVSSIRRYIERVNGASPPNKTITTGAYR